MQFTIQPITPAQTYPLRHQVLELAVVVEVAECQTFPVLCKIQT